MTGILLALKQMTIGKLTSGLKGSRIERLWQARRQEMSLTLTKGIWTAVLMLYLSSLLDVLGIWRLSMLLTASAVALLFSSIPKTTDGM
jgi:hypothetical protein